MTITPARCEVIIVALEFIIEHKLGNKATQKLVEDLRDEFIRARNNSFPLTFELPSLPSLEAEQAHAASVRPETRRASNAEPSGTNGAGEFGDRAHIARLSKLAADLCRGLTQAIRKR